MCGRGVRHNSSRKWRDQVLPLRPSLYPHPASLSHRSIGIMSPLNVDQARAAFPSLASGFIFGDNAGGSQVAQPVIDRFTDYLINTNAQLGADYSVSAESTRRVMSEAPEEARKLFNATSAKEVVFGPSSTANLENLARGLEKGIKPGDEFIVTGEHEGKLDEAFLPALSPF